MAQILIVEDDEENRNLLRMLLEANAYKVTVAGDGLEALRRFSAAMDAITDAIYLVDRASMRFIHINDAACRMRKQTREEMFALGPEGVLSTPREELERIYDQIIADGGVADPLELQRTRADGSQVWLELRRHAQRSGEGWTIVTLARDITDRKAAEAAILRFSQLYAALSHSNAAIARSGSEAELAWEICRIAVRYGGMSMAWIGLVDPSTRAIRPAASFGEHAVEYLQDIKLSVDADSPYGRGPVGISIRENRPEWFQDFQNDPRAAPWHKDSRRFGWRSAFSLPLRRNRVPIGALVLYAADASVFELAVRKLLIEMASNIDFALDNFAREATRTHAEQDLRAAEEQFRGLVEQPIAGIFIIQDDKLAYVNPRFAEIFGYASADDLIGRDSLSLVIEKERSAVLDLRRKIESSAQSMNYGFTAARKDGTLIEIGVHGARATHKGRPAVIGLIHDVSEKKRAEEQIQRYLEQLKTAFMSTVEVATTLNEMRDPHTAGHERHVGEIAAALGTELGLDEQRIEGLRVAGFLHDIGKTTVPVEILSKPGKLSPIEYELIKGHPQAGYDVLKDVKFPWPVADIALQHHERMDGSGYPQGLKGDAILLEARIMAVADVMEAMSSYRPYRPRLGVDAVLGEIERGRGTAYDPAVADACLRLFRERGYRLPE
jgi:PAS domain S-box-containing protein/putative nucleotidyltransferase with HDIG domain